MEKLQTDVKNILGLQLPSDPRWVNLAEMQLEEIKILKWSSYIPTPTKYKFIEILWA